MAAGRSVGGARPRGRKAAPRVALVDASNVAHSTEGEKARLRNVRLVRDRLREEGMEPVLVADAALRHQIDDEAELERMVDAGELRQAPAGTDADYFIVRFAKEMDGVIVTNDRYRDLAQSFPEIRDRVIRYMIVEDEVVFEKRNGHRRGRTRAGRK